MLTASVWVHSHSAWTFDLLPLGSSCDSSRDSSVVSCVPVADCVLWTQSIMFVCLAATLPELLERFPDSLVPVRIPAHECPFKCFNPSESSHQYLELHGIKFPIYFFFSVHHIINFSAPSCGHTHLLSLTFALAYYVRLNHDYQVMNFSLSDHIHHGRREAGGRPEAHQGWRLSFHLHSWNHPWRNDHGQYLDCPVHLYPSELPELICCLFYPQTLTAKDAVAKRMYQKE